jgi:excisionase family DNA binding protein
VTEGPKLLTVEDVARRLMVNPETVRIWLRQGKLRGMRPGGKRAGWRVTELDLNNYLEVRGNQGPAQPRLLP